MQLATNKGRATPLHSYMHLLLVEDDEMLGSAVKNALLKRGDNVEWAKDGEQGIYVSEAGSFDCVILDVNLPKLSGMEVIKHLRQVKNNVPVIMLTAMDALEYRVKGLEHGADDYLTKPFELDELYARIRALVRRHKGTVDTILRSSDIELDTAAKTVKRGDETILCTSKELKLLTYLMERKGKISSKSQLEEVLYGWDEDIDSNTIEVTVYNLRRKLGKDIIHNIRGVGYIIK